MRALHPEWTAHVSQHPISHDDDQRGPRFLASDAGRELATRVETRDASVPARDGYDIPVRVYTPKEQPDDEAPSSSPASPSSSSSPPRVVIFYHSGALLEGSLETEDVSCRYMAIGAAATVISVGYRLAPEHLYPVPMNDAWDAFEFIISNISSFLPSEKTNDSLPRSLPARLVVSGTSTGGHLSCLVTQRARDWLAADPGRREAVASSVSLEGVLLRAPVTVIATDPAYIPPRFRDLYQSWCPDCESARLTLAEMGKSFDTAGIPLDKRTSADTFPLWGSFQGLPKTYIQRCEVDILRDGAVCYAQGLKDAGVQVRETLFKDLPHIFWIYALELEVSKRAQEDCVQGLRWLFG